MAFFPAPSQSTVMSDPYSGYHGADPTVLQNDGASLAYQAVQHDQAQQFDLAMFYYMVFICIINSLPDKVLKITQKLYNKNSSHVATGK